MSADEIHRRSRWMIRALEWDDTRARYPNIWHEGMPAHVLAFETVASRLRLGDLVAVYHPASQRHAGRSERFVGISRVVGLRRSHAAAHAWIDLETAHRFDPPLDVGEGPRRVFLCCDPDWPARDGALFRRVLEAAVAAGFRPTPEEREEGAPGRPEREHAAPAAEGAAPPPAEGPGVPDEVATGGEEPREAPAVVHAIQPTPGARLFAGVDYSGDMRDPKEGTWLALVEMRGEGLHVVRLEPTGRAGLESQLRDSDAALMHAEAIGLDFPFGLPLAFAEALLGGPFPDEGWWALARRMEKLSRPDYLVALQEFRDAHGELKRLTDDRAGGFSPLHRVQPDLGPMTYHGIRMIAEERSRYAIRPFERARGRLLLEVYPGATARSLTSGPTDADEKPATIVAALRGAARLPVDMDPAMRGRCLGRRDALDAILAARCAAQAVLSGETERTPDELAPGDGDRVRREGWIYGVVEPA